MRHEPRRKYFRSPDTIPSAGAAKTDLNGNKLPAKGRIDKPLITFLLFIKSEIIKMILNNGLIFYWRLR